MCRAGRGSKHDDICRGLDRSDPVSEHLGKPRVGSAASFVTKRIDQMAVAADLDRADLLEIAGDCRLCHCITQAGEPFGELFLVGERGGANQVCDCPLSSFLEVGHRIFMHGLA